MLRADLHPRMPPDNGGGCAAVQHLTFFEKCAAGGTGMRGIRPRAGVLFVQRCSTLPFLRSVPQAAPGCGVSAPARRVPFRMHEKGPKVHIRGYPPYGTPGRVPAFGWAEKTRMSQPAPTCFLPRQAPPTRPGPHRRTPLHCARTDRCTRLAGGVLTRGGHCRPSCGVRRAAVAALAALRACARKPRVGAFWSGTQNAAHL